jgi:hypothetical protein
LKYEKLIKLFGDQIRIFRASNIDGSIPADESFTELATISIEADQLFTDYLDTTGGSDFWYKFVYRNSANFYTTDLADSIAVRGGDFGHYVSVSEIRNEAGFTNNPDITDQMIADRREDAESEVKGALSVAGYKLPLTNPIPSVVKNATKLLAAGYLLLQDYGVTAEGSNKEGQAKIDLAEKILKKIQNREIVLTDIKEASLAKETIIGGWPNDSTKESDIDESGGDVLFRISKQF